MPRDLHHFTSVHFRNFKAFRDFWLSLSRFNVLVGPNNAGKSTILAAFRILAEAMRKARSKNATQVPGPRHDVWGYAIGLSEVPVATENVFFDYDDSRPAVVEFRLSNGNNLTLFFPERDACYLIPDSKARVVRTVAQFADSFNAPIGFVPILGPVEHEEQLFQKDGARLALLTHRASRNFRNIWYHYPEDFDQFRALIHSTWPGMDIQRPEVDYSREKPLLHMFCPEERIPREIFWAGFGFQVWCQMLTYIIRGRNASLFIIDEPDIYLHSDLQRQLVSILKTLGPDMLLATHSTEIVSEADPDDLVVVNKRLASGKRIRDPSDLQRVFQVLGSNLNPILTQLAKTKRALFVEGKDFQVLARFARKLGRNEVANRADFAVIPVDGFNPQKVKDFSKGIETTLGAPIRSGVIFDRDYRSQEEVDTVSEQLGKVSSFAVIHGRKELENFLLEPASLKRAIERRLAERKKRTGAAPSFAEDMPTLLAQLTDALRNKVQAQFLARRQQFEKSLHPDHDFTTINEPILAEFDRLWSDVDTRLRVVPGKEVLALLNKHLQEKYEITLSVAAVIEGYARDDISEEMRALIDRIDKFRKEAA